MFDIISREHTQYRRRFIHEQIGFVLIIELTELIAKYLTDKAVKLPDVPALHSEPADLPVP